MSSITIKILTQTQSLIEWYAFWIFKSQAINAHLADEIMKGTNQKSHLNIILIDGNARRMQDFSLMCTVEILASLSFHPPRIWKSS